MYVISQDWVGWDEGSGSTVVAYADTLKSCRTFAQTWVKSVTPPEADRDFVSLVARKVPHYSEWKARIRNVVEVTLVDSKDGAWFIP